MFKGAIFSSGDACATVLLLLLLLVSLQLLLLLLLLLRLIRWSKDNKDDALDVALDDEASETDPAWRVLLRLQLLLLLIVLLVVLLFSRTPVGVRRASLASICCTLLCPVLSCPAVALAAWCFLYLLLLFSFQLTYFTSKPILNQLRNQSQVVQ